MCLFTCCLDPISPRFFRIWLSLNFSGFSSLYNLNNYLISVRSVSTFLNFFLFEIQILHTIYIQFRRDKLFYYGLHSDLIKKKKER